MASGPGGSVRIGPRDMDRYRMALFNYARWEPEHRTPWLEWLSDRLQEHYAKRDALPWKSVSGPQAVQGRTNYLDGASWEERLLRWLVKHEEVSSLLERGKRWRFGELRRWGLWHAALCDLYPDSQDQRRVLAELVLVDGKSQDEAAEELGMSRGWASDTYRRVTGQIVERLAENWEP